MDVGGGILYCWSCASYAMGRVCWGPRLLDPLLFKSYYSTVKSLLPSFLMLRVSEQAVSSGWFTFTGQTTQAMKTNNPKHLRPLLVRKFTPFSHRMRKGLC